MACALGCPGQVALAGPFFGLGLDAVKTTTA